MGKKRKKTYFVKVYEYKTESCFVAEITDIEMFDNIYSSMEHLIDEYNNLEDYCHTDEILEEIETTPIDLYVKNFILEHFSSAVVAFYNIPIEKIVPKNWELDGVLHLKKMFDNDGFEYTFEYNLGNLIYEVYQDLTDKTFIIQAFDDDDDDDDDCYD